MGAQRRSLILVGDRGQERPLGGRDICVGPQSLKASPGGELEGIQGSVHPVDKGPEL